MSGLRIDYVKVRYSYRTDYTDSVLQGIQMTTELEAEFRSLAGTQCNFSFSYENEGWKNVFFEAWGQGAENLIQQDPHLLFNNSLTVTRLDIRREIQHTPPYDALETLLREQRRRNITRINSRPRTKKGDRDAGGYGLRVGSHQAIRSLILYQRGDETPAIELTLRGVACYTFLSDLTETCKAMLQPSLSTPDPRLDVYNLVVNAGYAALVDFVAKIWGPANIPFVMNGGQPDTAAKAKLVEWLAKSLSALPPSVRAAVLTDQDTMF